MIVSSIRFGRAVSAGLLGTVAMTILMYGWPLVGLPRMDIVAALGGVLPFKISPYVVGSLIHVGVGIMLALIYALLFEPWLRGPGWLRGALFSLLPWLFAITLLGPTLLVATEFFKGAPAASGNPCAQANPCASAVNPRAAAQPKANPCASAATANPCATNANPCAPQNPCGGNPISSSALPPQAMSLMVHLLYGAVLGVVYRPSAA